MCNVSDILLLGAHRQVEELSGLINNLPAWSVAGQCPARRGTHWVRTHGSGKRVRPTATRGTPSTQPSRWGRRRGRGGGRRWRCDRSRRPGREESGRPVCGASGNTLGPYSRQWQAGETDCDPRNTEHTLVFALGSAPRSRRRAQVITRDSYRFTPPCRFTPLRIPYFGTRGG